MTIKIGNIEVNDPVFLAPMSGITDLPFRRIVNQLCKNIVFSEMVASKEIISPTFKKQNKFPYKHSHNSIFAIQLVGYDPIDMSEAARLCEQLGADIIDINMGCPSKKVTGHLCGSALMKDLKMAESIIKATVSAVKLPVTLKMRIGIQQIGMLLILMLMITVIVNDVGRLFTN